METIFISHIQVYIEPLMGTIFSHIQVYLEPLMGTIFFHIQVYLEPLMGTICSLIHNILYQQYPIPTVSYTNSILYQLGLIKIDGDILIFYHYKDIYVILKK